MEDHDWSVCQATEGGDVAGKQEVDLPCHVQGQLASMTHNLANDIAKLCISARDSGNLQELGHQTCKRSCEFTETVLDMLQNDQASHNKESPGIMKCVDLSEFSQSITPDQEAPVQTFGLPGIDTYPLTSSSTTDIQPDASAAIDANAFPDFGVFHHLWDYDMGGSNSMFADLPEDESWMDIQ